MILKHLSLARVRAFEQADFDFQPGMNLLVGVNGAGKSTILDVLRSTLSYALPQFTASRSRPIAFTEDDITVGQNALTIELDFEAAGIPFEHLIHFPRKDFVVDESKEGQVRHQTIELVERNELSIRNNINLASLKQQKEQPLVLFFSTRRATYNRAQPTKQRSAGDQAAAYADALAPRGLYIREFAEWWLARQTLAKEKKELGQILDFLNLAVTELLENCSNLRAERHSDASLVVDKNGVKLDVSQLSDGERGLLVLALDLGLRLSQANPELEDPLQAGKAVVLIDELDLHLHPQWQRTIVDKLTDTFRNCQFICTTHSPLIIGETQPSNLYLLTQIDNQIQVKRKAYSYGLDANWILEHLMKTPVRPETVQTQITRVEDALENGELNKAREELATLREMMHSDVNEVVRLEASINTLEALADEMDSEE